MIPLEIERKFLITQTPELDEFCTERIDIVQTYLTRSDPLVQRRVRSMKRNGCTEYFYTEKRFVRPSVREENESVISAEEYEHLLEQADDSLKTITKTRRILLYKNQRFEIDSYPFSDKLATIELELDSENQEISFPDYINIIKEVTGDERYSNANLALNGSFPEIISAKKSGI